MGIIIEPNGVDFIISSDPLTNEARKIMSEFIRNYKMDAENKKNKLTKNMKKSKAVKTLR